MSGENGAPSSTPDDPEEATRENRRVKVWRRWTDVGDVPFHQYCVLKPTRPPLSLFGDDSADGTGTTRKYPEGTEPPLSYAPPFARWALRHTPFLVLITTGIFVILNFSPIAVRTAGSLFASMLTPLTGIAVFVLVVWIVILALLVRSVLHFPSDGSIKGIVVYGLLIFLTVGMFLGIYVATPNASLPVSEPVADAITSFPFAFLWMLLVGGHLVYDGMLRTENMFTKLQTKVPPVIEDEGEYEDFLIELQNDFDASIDVANHLPDRFAHVWWLPSEIKKASLFSVLFVAPFFFIWWFVPIGEDPISNFVVRGIAGFIPAVLDFFLVIVFFQFLILISYFNRLLTDRDRADPDRANVSLIYDPKHPDEYAGFRDLGSFATRVNVILIVGGIYEAYHLYVWGFRAIPELSQGVTLEFVSWGFSNILPLITYVFAVVIWLYLSFWQLHKTMRRVRERKLEEHAHPSEESEGAYTNETVEELRNGPVWPVKSRLLVSIVSMDLMPLLTLLPFLRF